MLCRCCASICLSLSLSRARAATHALINLPLRTTKNNNQKQKGTNVILERQQRLTEEFVPRADLVLFVLSADRPLSDSELRFLQYIRTWRKKVVFVVNKVRCRLFCMLMFLAG